MLPLIVRQTASTTVAGLLREDGDVAIWWGTWGECAVALSRLVREGTLNEASEEEARSRLDLLAHNGREIRPTHDMRLLAVILSKDRHLKAADCLQLAAALRWCEGNTEGRGLCAWTTVCAGRPHGRASTCSPNRRKKRRRRVEALPASDLRGRSSLRRPRACPTAGGGAPDRRR